jgi:hypothetical protein
MQGGRDPEPPRDEDDILCLWDVGGGRGRKSSEPREPGPKNKLTANLFSRQSIIGILEYFSKKANREWVASENITDCVRGRNIFTKGFLHGFV